MISYFNNRADLLHDDMSRDETLEVRLQDITRGRSHQSFAAPQSLLTL
jgi:hypothetical protein